MELVFFSTEVSIQQSSLLAYFFEGVTQIQCTDIGYGCRECTAPEE